MSRVSPSGTPKDSVIRARTALAVAAASAAVVLALSAQAFAQSGSAGYDPGHTHVAAAPPGRALATASTAAPAQAVANYLRASGFGAASVDALRQVGANTGRNGLMHLRMEQQVGGLRVYGRYLKAAINSRGELVHVVENLAVVPAVPLAGPAISPKQALTSAMAFLYSRARVDVGQAVDRGDATTFARGTFFLTDPTVTRVAVPASDGSMTIGLLVETWSRAENLLHHTLVGGDGRILDVQLRTAADSYNVFAIDPGKTPQTVVTGPGTGNTESPAGWLGAGRHWTTLIRGNNVSAYLDTDANDHPDRGGSAVTSGDFLAAANLGVSPSTTASSLPPEPGARPPSIPRPAASFTGVAATAVMKAPMWTSTTSLPRPGFPSRRPRRIRNACGIMEFAPPG